MKDFAVYCHNVSKTFGNVRALDSLHLEVRQGEILALVGPSGCGKTTLLRLLAGFDRPDSGEIVIGGQVVAGDGCFLPPEQRGVGMVFQDYALFPHLSAADNVVFGLDKLPKAQRRPRVEEMLALVGLEGYGERFPHELSGGERQRVALARAMAPKPVLILLDEPFSNLDADRRVQMREEVQAILKTAGATAIFVTHDQEEALFIGDRLAILRKGWLEQVGQPDVVFHAPATRFVAEFMGQTDFLPGRVTKQGIQTEIGLLAQRVTAPEGALVEVAVRGDDIAVACAGSAPAQGGAVGRVLARHFRGALNVYRLKLPSGQIIHSMQPHTCIFQPGADVCVFADPNHNLACFCEGRAVQVEAA
jgi:iron(III) transport system ATP-binding protein